MKCPQCGKSNPKHMNFCLNCGTRLGENICPQCGIVNPQDTSFCQNCGASLKGTTNTVYVSAASKKKINYWVIAALLLLLLLLLLFLHYCAGSISIWPNNPVDLPVVNPPVNPIKPAFIVVTPNRAQLGTTFQMELKDFASNDNIQTCWYFPSGALVNCADLVADQNGYRHTVYWSHEGEPTGQYKVVAEGKVSKASASATWVIDPLPVQPVVPKPKHAPTIIVNPWSGKANSTFKIFFSYFQPNEKIKACIYPLYSSLTNCYFLDMDGNGYMEFQWIKKVTVGGQYIVDVVGNKGSVSSAVFIIVISPGVTPSTNCEPNKPCIEF